MAKSSVDKFLDSLIEKLDPVHCNDCKKPIIDWGVYVHGLKSVFCNRGKCGGEKIAEYIKDKKPEELAEEGPVPYHVSYLKKIQLSGGYINPPVKSPLIVEALKYFKGVFQSQ